MRSTDESFRRTARAARGLLLFVLSAAPIGGMAADLMVVGTPHLSTLEPDAGPQQVDRVVDALAQFRPTQVCIEAVPGERIEAFVREPNRYGELLATFAMDAIRLAPEQQARRALAAADARRRAAALADQAALAPADEAMLISTQLASYDVWSAVLNWSRLDEAGRNGARPILGAAASERLEELSKSRNEIARLAVPLARRLGHRQLCAVDHFEDEIAVAVLADELQAVLSAPAIGQGVQDFNAWVSEDWPGDPAAGLLQLMRLHNGAEFARRDRAAEWEIFLDGAGAHPAGERRLMLWHARNAAIQLELLRAAAGKRGDRTLLLIGAAHRPFLEDSLRALPWVTVHQVLSVLEPRPQG